VWEKVHCLIACSGNFSLSRIIAYRSIPSHPSIPYKTVSMTDIPPLDKIASTAYGETIILITTTTQMSSSPAIPDTIFKRYWLGIGGNGSGGNSPGNICRPLTFPDNIHCGHPVVIIGICDKTAMGVTGVGYRGKQMVGSGCGGIGMIQIIT
jgi:hypothetical protein